MFDRHGEHRFAGLVHNVNGIIKIDRSGVVKIQTIILRHGNLTESGDQTDFLFTIFQSDSVFRRGRIRIFSNFLNENTRKTVSDGHAFFIGNNKEYA